jgi:hypothetical protein
MKLKTLRTYFYYLAHSLFFIKIRPEFTFLFYDKEGRTLLGRRFINLWFLILIFLLTFLAIGFANGSLKYLQKKMDDPFVSWLNIDIPSSKADKIDQMINDLKKDSLDRSIYKYKFVTGYNFWSLNIFDRNKNKSRGFYGRTIDVEDPLLKEILSEKFFLRGRVGGFSGNNDVGIIVTERMLTMMNYSKNDGFIAMDFSDNEIPRRVLIPVICVVKELPNFTDFLCTQHFYNQRNVHVSLGNAFSPENISSVSFITCEGDKKIEDFQANIKKHLLNNKAFANIDIIYNRYSENTLSYVSYNQIDIKIFDDTSMIIRDKIYKAIESMPDFDAAKYQRYFDYYPNLTSDDNVKRKFDRISIEFPDRDKVKAFKKFMAGPPFELNIELGQIEAMENYNFITKLTRIISIILVIFSIISISLFVSNLMQNHLEKIKMNIGTFLAFGIDYKSLERIYLSMIYMVLIGAIAIGLLIAWLIGTLGFVRFILSSLGEKLEDKEIYYEQFSGWTIVLLIIVLITSYISIIRVTSKVFRQTPGDLLYERT